MSILHRIFASKQPTRADIIAAAQARLLDLMAAYPAKQARKRADAARRGWERRRAGA